ncbi:MAG: FxsA family protein, partial [Propioniciclava sp.]
MRARWLIPLVLLVGVIAEVWILVFAVDRLGILATVGILVGMAVLGGVLWRRQGTKALASLAEMPADAGGAGRRVTDAALVVIAGGLLILPGFISDLLALFCLLPGTRAVARQLVAAIGSTITRPYRTQLNLMDVRIHPDTVVPGEAVPEDPTSSRTQPR